MNPEHLNGTVCHYCGCKTMHVPSTEIYTKDYGQMFYLCKPCNAYVGCYKKEPTVSFGIVANDELRAFKRQAHAYFDVLWKAKMLAQNVSKHNARNAGYLWLSKNMGLTIDETHIGMFTIEQCKMVVEICKPFTKPYISIPNNTIRT